MDSETLLKLLTIAFSVGLSWGTVRSVLSTMSKTVEKLEEATAKHEVRISTIESTSPIHQANLHGAIGRVEGQVAALHKRLDNFLGGRTPRPGHPSDVTD